MTSLCNYTVCGGHHRGNWVVDQLHLNLQKSISLLSDRIGCPGLPWASVVFSGSVPRPVAATPALLSFVENGTVLGLWDLASSLAPSLQGPTCLLVYFPPPRGSLLSGLRTVPLFCYFFQDSQHVNSFFLFISPTLSKSFSVRICEIKPGKFLLWALLQTSLKAMKSWHRASYLFERGRGREKT